MSTPQHATGYNQAGWPDVMSSGDGRGAWTPRRSASRISVVAALVVGIMLGLAGGWAGAKFDVLPGLASDAAPAAGTGSTADSAPVMTLAEAATRYDELTKATNAPIATLNNSIQNEAPLAEIRKNARAASVPAQALLKAMKGPGWPATVQDEVDKAAVPVAQLVSMFRAIARANERGDILNAFAGLDPRANGDVEILRAALGLPPTEA